MIPMKSGKGLLPAEDGNRCVHRFYKNAIVALVVFCLLT